MTGSGTDAAGAGFARGGRGEGAGSGRREDCVKSTLESRVLPGVVVDLDPEVWRPMAGKPEDPHRARPGTRTVVEPPSWAFTSTPEPHRLEPSTRHEHRISLPPLVAPRGFPRRRADQLSRVRAVTTEASKAVASTSPIAGSVPCGDGGRDCRHPPAPMRRGRRGRAAGDGRQRGRGSVRPRRQRRRPAAQQRRRGNRGGRPLQNHGGAARASITSGCVTRLHPSDNRP